MAFLRPPRDLCELRVKAFYLPMTDKILILDFGSQVTQLIARRVRESGVYCEIHPFTISEDRVRDYAPRAIILSGGPASLTETASPRVPEIVFRLGVPVLGICYGMQTMCAQLGGRVTLSEHQEFGRAFIDIIGRLPSIRGPLAQRRARAGMDEPRRPGRCAASGVPGRGIKRRSALRRHCR